VRRELLGKGPKSPTALGDNLGMCSGADISRLTWCFLEATVGFFPLWGLQAKGSGEPRCLVGSKFWCLLCTDPISQFL
jgi:hypothetical protein